MPSFYKKKLTNLIEKGKILDFFSDENCEEKFLKKLPEMDFSNYTAPTSKKGRIKLEDLDSLSKYVFFQD